MPTQIISSVLPFLSLSSETAFALIFSRRHVKDPILLKTSKQKAEKCFFFFVTRKNSKLATESKVAQTDHKPYPPAKSRAIDADATIAEPSSNIIVMWRFYIKSFSKTHIGLPKLLSVCTYGIIKGLNACVLKANINKNKSLGV